MKRVVIKANHESQNISMVCILQFGIEGDMAINGGEGVGKVWINNSIEMFLPMTLLKRVKTRKYSLKLSI